MSLFAVVDFEEEVQVGDKTRIDCTKSFNSKATTAITTLTVTPQIGGSATSVFDSADQDQWFLDWVYSDVKYDVGTGNDDLVFTLSGTEYTLDLANANYATLTAYAVAVAAAMQVAVSNSFTSSVAAGKVTISGTTAFAFKRSSVASQLNVTLDTALVSHTGAAVEYGVRKVTVAAGNAAPLSNSKDVFIKVFSEEGDRLFCSDQDLVAHEADILKWVSPGRSSFKNVYRRAQKLIIAWLDEKGYVNAYGKKYDKNDIRDLEEVRQWATFMSLRLIFEGISNSVDDVFRTKAKAYDILEQGARQRTILRIDYDQDGDADITEGTSISSGSLFRR